MPESLEPTQVDSGLGAPGASKPTPVTSSASPRSQAPALTLERLDGDPPIPPGYDRQPVRAHNALILAGSITGATAYGLSFIAASYGTPELFVPLLGPWLALHRMSSHCDRSGDSTDVPCWTPQQLAVIDGVLQTAGAGLIVAGLLIPKYRLVPQIDQSLRVRVVPFNLGKKGGGIGIVGQF